MSPSRIVTEDRRGGEKQTRLEPARADRIIRALSWWWASAPLILCTPLIAYAAGLPDVRREAGGVFGLVALVAAVLAPTAGLVVTRLGDRRKARGRFLIMAAVSSVPILFFLFFGVLYSECPSGGSC
ncbi:hypothetical protein ACFVQ4_12620 [Streptomyces laurentii]|uniref:hypothetical protein n=1 Tax=Streptomyces laurentii TaxID=39478 RepID=UPI0036898C2B